jgi:hypothetical protein
MVSCAKRWRSIGEGSLKWGNQLPKELALAGLSRRSIKLGALLQLDVISRGSDWTQQLTGEERYSEMTNLRAQRVYADITKEDGNEKEV